MYPVNSGSVVKGQFAEVKVLNLDTELRLLFENKNKNKILDVPICNALTNFVKICAIRCFRINIVGHFKKLAYPFVLGIDLE